MLRVGKTLNVGQKLRCNGNFALHGTLSRGKLTVAQWRKLPCLSLPDVTTAGAVCVINEVSAEREDPDGHIFYSVYFPQIHATDCFPVHDFHIWSFDLFFDSARIWCGLNV